MNKADEHYTLLRTKYPTGHGALALGKDCIFLLTIDTDTCEKHPVFPKVVTCVGVPLSTANLVNNSGAVPYVNKEPPIGRPKEDPNRDGTTAIDRNDTNNSHPCDYTVSSKKDVARSVANVGTDTVTTFLEG